MKRGVSPPIYHILRLPFKTQRETTPQMNMDRTLRSTLQAFLTLLRHLTQERVHVLPAHYPITMLGPSLNMRSHLDDKARGQEVFFVGSNAAQIAGALPLTTSVPGASDHGPTIQARRDELHGEAATNAPAKLGRSGRPLQGRSLLARRLSPFAHKWVIAALLWRRGLHAHFCW